MTFGEHLEELRKSLLKAAVWLAFGLAIGLYFANHVVQFVQRPLEAAITRFMADQTLFKMGIDPNAPDATSMRVWLVEHGMIYETVYMIDEEAVRRSEELEASQSEASQSEAASAENEKSKANNASSSVTPETQGEKKTSPSAKPDVPAKGNTESKTPEPAESSEPSDIFDDQNASASQMPEVVFRDPTNHLKPVTIWRPASTSLNAFQMEETFMIWLKAGLVVGAVLGSPGIFYHLWQFVAAGLYPHERKYVYVYMPFSVVLFASGVILAFFLVLKYVLDFLLTFNAAANVDLVPRLSNYVNFVLLLPLGFGIAFQLPLVMLFLQRIGLFETQSYIASWRIAVLVIAVLSMILTPADIYSMIALMVPLVLLYFLGIFLCQFMPRGRGIGSEGYDPA
ncbi:MAG: twin-arginine translocase subunit TatC [Pirellulaceae bacterium]